MTIVKGSWRLGEGGARGRGGGGGRGAGSLSTMGIQTDDKHYGYAD